MATESKSPSSSSSSSSGGKASAQTKTDRALKNEREIGRASCRERV